MSGARCRQLQRYHQYYAVTSQCVVGGTINAVLTHAAVDFSSYDVVPVLLIIRTYALYNRSKRILISLMALAVTCAIVCSNFCAETQGDISDFTDSLGPSQVVFISENVNLPQLTANRPLGFRIAGCDLYLTAEQ